MDRSGLTSSPEASWLAALTNNVSNQKLYNNIVKELINGVIRAGSWLVLSLVGSIICLHFYLFCCYFQILCGIGDFPSGWLGREGREERTSRGERMLRRERMLSGERTLWRNRTWGGTGLGRRRGEQLRGSPEHVFSRIEQRLTYLNM